MAKRNKKFKRIMTSLFSLFLSIVCLNGNFFHNTSLSVFEPLAETTLSDSQVPQIWSVSDAVKPGESITLQGAYLYERGNTSVFISENQGEEPSTAPPQNATEITSFLSVDEAGEGLIFPLPSYFDAGEYDLWVQTSAGRSNAVTLNASRPLYLDQEATYEGLPIEIIGRNLLENEYGVGNEASAIANAKVKLVSKADSAKTYVVGVENAVRYDETQSVTGKAVTDSNPYRLTFITPNADVGEYDVFVAADGEDFRGLFYPQTLKIVNRKSRDWDTAIFGTDYTSHIGNDPLDLQVYWAQDFNYGNVKTMTPFEAEPSDVNDASITSFHTTLFSEVQKLRNSGGGVVYFPEGDYYLNGINDRSEGCLFENIIFVGDGADKTRIFYADNANGGTWIRVYASNVGFARMSFEQWDTESANKRPDNPLAFFDTSSSTDIDKQETKNRFVTDVRFRFSIDYVSGSTNRCYNTFSGDKNLVYRNIDWYGGNTTFRCNVYRYVTVENMRAEFNGIGTASFECVSSYSTLENVSIQAQQTDGHGYSCRGGIYVGNCHVANVGNIASDGANKGEAIMFEPPGGVFSTGTVAQATANTVTTTRIGGSEVGTDTQLLYDNPAIYIVGGKGAGQMRFIKKLNDTATNLNASNTHTYEFLEGEREWDIIPDETSQFTIMSPQDGSTVYRFKAEHCLKGIYLYSQIIDTVVAECDMQDTEGIFLTSVANVSQGRINANAGVRIVNNEITGVSPGSNEGGIQIRTHSVGTASEVLFGTATRNVVVRGNTLTNTYPDSSQTYSTPTEMMHYSGINVHTDIQGVVTAGAVENGKADFKLLVIEDNEVNNGEYGVYSKAFVKGMVVRRNSVTAGAATKLAYSIDKTWAPNVYFHETSAAPSFDGGKSVTLDAAIGVNVYATFEGVPKALRQHTQVYYEVGEKTVSVPYTDDGGEGARKAFSCPIAPKQINDEITMRLIYDGEVVDETTYSAAQYARDVIENKQNDEGLIALCKALLNYGAYAQIYFDYRTDALANATLNAADTVLGEIDGVAPSSQTGDYAAAGLTKPFQGSLVCEDRTAIRLYFATDDVERLTVRVNGVALAPVAVEQGSTVDGAGYTHYVEIAYGALDMDERYTVSVGSYSVQYSALSYLQDVAAGSGQPLELVRLAKAIYCYSLAAENYFASY